MNAVLGYDPGVNGAISVLDSGGRVIFSRGLDRKMTEDQALGVAEGAAIALFTAGGWQGYCEKVQHMTGDGAKGSHTFGYTKGLIRGALKTRGVHLYDVPPQLWMSAMGCLTGGDKNVSKRRAIELFPGVDITHKNADSLLIALYGRMMASGTGR